MQIDMASELKRQGHVNARRNFKMAAAGSGDRRDRFFERIGVELYAIADAAKIHNVEFMIWNDRGATLMSAAGSVAGVTAWPRCRTRASGKRRQRQPRKM